MQLKDQVVVVTGAGSGIGRALALTFAAQGAKVACCGRRLERLEGVVAEIEAAGGRGLAVAVDVTDEAAVKAAVAKIKNEWGRIDVLFNNAGSFASLGAVHEVDMKTWWTDVTINLKGPMLMIHSILSDMLKRNSGVIINMDGGRPVGGSGYAAGKAGLIELSRVLSKELQELDSKVVVLTAGPGLVYTEMTELQISSEAGRRWIPSTKECVDNGTVRSPFEVAHKTIEVLQNLVPEWSGKAYGPDTQLPLK